MSKVTMDQIMAAAAEDDNLGFCVRCGAEVAGIEPDAHRCTCDVCGAPCVYGAEELLHILY